MFIALGSSISDNHQTNWGNKLLVEHACVHSDYFQVLMLRLVCMPLQMADERRDVGSTHEEPGQCTQKTPMHLFSAGVVR
eukprot:610181-Prorocentrum_lima.AAC.1